MCSVYNKWFVNNPFFILDKNKLKVELVCILVHITIVVWFLSVNGKLNNKTVSAHLINFGIVLLLPELKVVPELVSSNSVSIHDKS